MDYTTVFLTRLSFLRELCLRCSGMTVRSQVPGAQQRYCADCVAAFLSAIDVKKRSKKNFITLKSVKNLTLIFKNVCSKRI